MHAKTTTMHADSLQKLELGKMTADLGYLNDDLEFIVRPTICAREVIAL